MNRPYETLTDAAIQKIILLNCKRLRRVDLSCSRISLQTLKLIEQTQNIKYLRVWNVPNIAEALSQLRDARKDMEVVVGEEDETLRDTECFRTRMMDSYLKRNLIQEKIIPERESVLTSKPAFPEEDLPFIDFFWPHFTFFSPHTWPLIRG